MKAITLGCFDTPMHEATAAAVIRILEAYGIEEIDLISGDYAALAHSLQKGEVDLFATVWMPNVHQKLIESSHAMNVIGHLYQPNLFWALSSAADLAVYSIPDLLESKAIERNIRVPESIFHITQLVFNTYELAKENYQLQPIPDEEAFLFYKEMIAEEKTIIVPLFQPHFLDEESSLQRLNDPKGVLDIPHKASLLLRTELIKILDEDLIDELEGMTLGNQVVKAMEQAMRVEHMTSHEAAEAWQRGKLSIRV